jgi:glycosyltransferase involved in cell wall biosynthesis
MGNLGTRFIFGPLAGGEKAPWRLRAGFPFRGIFLDFLRDMGNFFIRFDPINHSALAKAKTIYVTSQQTKALIPSKFRSKTKVKLAIGISDKWHEQHVRLSSKASEKFKILFVGRFLYWKGMYLGLSAIAEVAKHFPNIQLTMVGEGPEESEWKKQAQQLGLASKIEWIPWVSKQKLVRLYQTHHLFLFPSLHDSGGMVVLEALTQGLPVICLDLGGPGVIIDDSCGIKITTIKKTEKDIVKDLSIALLNLLNDSDTLGRLQEGALNRMSKFAWKHIINDIYQ